MKPRSGAPQAVVGWRRQALSAGWPPSPRWACACQQRPLSGLPLSLACCAPATPGGPRARGAEHGVGGSGGGTLKRAAAGRGLSGTKGRGGRWGEGRWRRTACQGRDVCEDDCCCSGRAQSCVVDGAPFIKTASALAWSCCVLYLFTAGCFLACFAGRAVRAANGGRRRDERVTGSAPAGQASTHGPRQGKQGGDQAHRVHRLPGPYTLLLLRPACFWRFSSFTPNIPTRSTTTDEVPTFPAPAAAAWSLA